MKNKAPLPLMEQIIMILVFALTAALCLQGFSLASRLSRRQEAQTRAMLEVQNTAELFKHFAGDYAKIAQQKNGTLIDTLDGQHLSVSYDRSWETISPDETSYYRLTAVPVPTKSNLTEAATITLSCQEEPLFSLTVTWQNLSREVIPHG